MKQERTYSSLFYLLVIVEFIKEHHLFDGLCVTVMNLAVSFNIIFYTTYYVFS